MGGSQSLVSPSASLNRTTTTATTSFSPSHRMEEQNAGGSRTPDGESRFKNENRASKASLFTLTTNILTRDSCGGRWRGLTMILSVLFAVSGVCRVCGSHFGRRVPLLLFTRMHSTEYRVVLTVHSLMPDVLPLHILLFFQTHLPSSPFPRVRGEREEDSCKVRTADAEREKRHVPTTTTPASSYSIDYYSCCCWGSNSRLGLNF